MRVGDTVHINLIDSDYDPEFVKTFHDTIGKIVEISGEGIDALYTVAVPGEGRADFSILDLFEWN